MAEKKNIVIWGCGQLGQNLASAMDKTVCNIVFCDATKDMVSITVDGIVYEKILPADLHKRNFDYLFIGSAKKAESISVRIRELGIPAHKVIKQNINQEKIGLLRELFTLSGYTYLCHVLEKTELDEMKSNLKLLDADRALMREYLIADSNKPCESTKKRIGVICLDAIFNVTERVISACSRYLLKNATSKKDCELVNIDFYNPNYEVLSSCDAIVFAGGGIIKLNSIAFDFPRLIDNITLIAQRYSIPVLFNGVGVEDYFYDQESYILMQRALNRSCVKIIAVRENLPAMQKYIYNPNIKVVLASDPALFTKEAYRLSEKKAENPVIGVGVVTFVNWEREGYPIEKEELLSFYSKLFLELESRGYQWKLFCNGIMRDNTFLQDICAMDSTYQAHVVQRPKTDKEWLKTMQGFSGVIAPRLHTNIVSYSLGIPCVALVWNQKIKSFAESVNTPWFTPDQFDVKKIVDALEQTQINNDILMEKQSSVRQIVNEFVTTYLFPKPKVPFWKKLLRKIKRIFH